MHDTNVFELLASNAPVSNYMGNMHTETCLLLALNKVCYFCCEALPTV